MKFNFILFGTETSDLVQEQCLTRLIPQAVFDEITATRIVDGASEDFPILQRDCVENLVRNFLNMAFLFPNGEFRPGAEEKLSSTHDKLRAYYTEHTPAERISNDPEMGRKWLETTIGFIGVEYAQANREIRSGIDNILALMEGFVPYLRNGGSIPGKSANQYRAYKLNKMCKWLSTETINIRFNPESIQNNHEDAKITFTLKEAGRKKQKESVTLHIGKRHVCIRHRDQLSA